MMATSMAVCPTNIRELFRYVLCGLLAISSSAATTTNKTRKFNHDDVARALDARKPTTVTACRQFLASFSSNFLQQNQAQQLKLEADCHEPSYVQARVASSCLAGSHLAYILPGDSLLIRNWQ
jgi:hypothetical protein